MENIINITRNVFLITMLILVVLYIPKFIFVLIGLKKQKPFKKAKTKHNIALIIPARFESKVIRGLLDSIKNQNYTGKMDSFVIVPDETDESIEICKEYENTYCHILDHKVSTKGATMDSLFKIINEKAPDIYDAFIIIDADNILDKSFVDYMNDAFDAGYDVVLGGRQNKNWKDGWVSNCSALTFSFVNGMNNKARTKLGSNVLISGSGLLVSKKVIQENDGWPWQTLTEDYEFSQITFIKNYKACYYELAKTFDEQPTTLKQSNTQLTRWLKGHSDVDAKYKKEMIKTLGKQETGKKKILMFEFMFSLVPVVLTIVSFVLFFILNLTYTFIALFLKSVLWRTALVNALLTLLIGWLLIMVYSAIGLICDRDNVRMDFKSATEALIMSPIFFARFVPIYIKALSKKEIKWERVEHSKVDKNENGKKLGNE